MAGWFAGVNFKFSLPINVQIANESGGGHELPTGTGGNAPPLGGGTTNLVNLPSPPEVTIPAGQTTATLTVTTNHNVASGTRRTVSILAIAVATKCASLTTTN